MSVIGIVHQLTLRDIANFHTFIDLPHFQT